MSPHFGLLDAAKMSREEALLLRARLHWRGGCRRLRQGKAASGVATLYDALLHGLGWRILTSPAGRVGCSGADLEDEGYLLAWAAANGLFMAPGDLARLQALIEAALRGEVTPAEQEWCLAQLEHLLTTIGVLPFAEASLPPEAPETY